MHTHTHAHTHTPTHTRARAHTHTRTHAHTHTHTRTHTRARTHAPTHACAHAHTHTLGARAQGAAYTPGGRPHRRGDVVEVRARHAHAAIAFIADGDQPSVTLSSARGAARTRGAPLFAASGRATRRCACSSRTRNGSDVSLKPARTHANQTNSSTHARTHAHTRTYAHTHTRTHTHTHTHTDAQTRRTHTRANKQTRT
jgi:hypothetical protein